ncbi:hypothetical protein LSTR_LSTR009594, partial [Laodelphax striatellus]
MQLMRTNFKRRFPSLRIQRHRTLSRTLNNTYESREDLLENLWEEVGRGGNELLPGLISSRLQLQGAPPAVASSSAASLRSTNRPVNQLSNFLRITSAGGRRRF